MSLGQTIHLDIVLAPASASEELTVTAQPSALDTAQTSVVSSVDQERIEELPVRSRNYLDFVLLAPGVSRSPMASAVSGSTPLTGTGFTFGGLRPQSNNISIDGLTTMMSTQGRVARNYRLKSCGNFRSWLVVSQPSPAEAARRRGPRHVHQPRRRKLRPHSTGTSAQVASLPG